MSSSGGIQPGGGGAVFPTYSGAGSPEGVQVGAVGDYYEDTATAILYAKISGAGNTGWQGLTALDSILSNVIADAPTTVPADGAGHVLPWLVAAPPVWADNAGNIILPGLYQLAVHTSPGVAPTTPGLPAAVGSSYGAAGFPLDSVSLTNLVLNFAVLGVPAGLGPIPVSVACVIANDVSATLVCAVSVTRLAYNPT